MLNWRIEYEAIDQEVRPGDTIRRTAKYHNLKWARNALDAGDTILGRASQV